MQCISESAECVGEVYEYTSRSGASTSERCEFHQAEYNVRMDAVYADVNERFPGYDNPHSVAPEWFDPSYAGEVW